MIDSPALAYIGSGKDRQAIGWAEMSADLRADSGESGAIVIYEGESTSEGFVGWVDCEPCDAEQWADTLDDSPGFEWAATQEAADWYAGVYGTQVVLENADGDIFRGKY